MSANLSDLADQASLLSLKAADVYDMVSDAEESPDLPYAVKSKAAVAKALARELELLVSEMNAIINRNN